MKDWVLAEPDSKVLLLSEDMEFLVLGTDGLWEKVWMGFLDFLKSLRKENMHTDIHMHWLFV